MSVIKPKFDTAGKAVTITLDSLASSKTDGRESAVVDNTTALYDFVTLHVLLKGANSGTIGNDKCVYVWAYEVPLDDDATPDDLYPGNVTGSDAAIAAIQEGALRYLGAIEFAAINTAYKKSFNLEVAFGGRVPRKWGVVLRNYTGIGLSATGSDHALHYHGGWYEVA